MKTIPNLDIDVGIENMRLESGAVAHICTTFLQYKVGYWVGGRVITLSKHGT